MTISMVAGNSLWKMMAEQYPVVQLLSAFPNSSLHFKTNLIAYPSSFETSLTPISSLLPLFLSPPPPWACSSHRFILPHLRFLHLPFSCSRLRWATTSACQQFQRISWMSVLFSTLFLKNVFAPEGLLWVGRQQWHFQRSLCSVGSRASMNTSNQGSHDHLYAI